MSGLTQAECPTCGWATLLPSLELAALGGCRLCGGPLTVSASPLPWHGVARVEHVRPRHP